ncbi:FAD-dependent oxidoreductase [Halopelagius longus]|uniref:FAD-dependent oxidoreductase n=1 Tax=Halopelagius longus TaxID=1236180 RepID=A0A1H1GL21_9EURY|nr:FAD-dependent oxidoreductase [Halopelagius longus]RDI69676.1 FAD-dependent oxidoreductase [Halopelagius longus]SDR13880.1 Glycine/D-amino acid oxidase [Halopelagius longus]
MSDTNAPDDAESHPTESVWMSTTEPTSYPPLDGDGEADVVVVGGGITGLTAATRLSEEGADVAVVESGRIVEGVTGRTTAKLTLQHGLIYDHLRSEFGAEKARRYADANQEAIETVKERVDRYDIDCDFDRTAAYTYTESTEKRAKISDEVDAATALDIPAAFVEDTPLPFDVEAAIRVEDQARFHPRKYLLALAETVEDAGNDIFEGTKATEIKSGDRNRVVTDRGTLTADAVVVATHFPILDHRLFFSRLYPHRSYVVTIRTDDAPTEGMYYRAEEPERTIRTKVAGEDDLLIVGGEGHKTGHGDSKERYRRLERYADEQFEVESMPYRWSTQDYGTPDRIPFVGRAGPGTDGVYVGTGFGGWGMTNGTAAGELLADLALGRSNPYEGVYDPTRVSKSSAKKAVKENTQVAKEFVEGWAEGLLGSGTVTPPAGESRIVRHDGKPYGLYRDEDGELHAVSAVCTHMDCIVKWNAAEKSWDCPCHGSRFEVDGDVIDGPAVEGLSNPGTQE